MSNSYQFDLPKIIEHLRVLVRRANKQGLSAATGIPYTRLIYFARSANTTPNPSDTTALAKHYLGGYTFTVPKEEVIDVTPQRQVVEAPAIAPPAPPVSAEAA